MLAATFFATDSGAGLIAMVRVNDRDVKEGITENARLPKPSIFI